jgi:phenylacetate-coenzyme A ligase PaaK-like adenylate-forming protein
MGRLVEETQRELENLDKMSRDEFAALRDIRLQEILLYHYNNPYNGSYKALLSEHGIKSADELPKSIGDITRLPIVTREFLEESGYAEKPCIPLEEVSRIVPTTGSTGNALRIPHTPPVSGKMYGKNQARLCVLGGIEFDSHSYFVSNWNPGIEDTSASHEYAMEIQKLTEGTLVDEAVATPLAKHYAQIKALAESGIKVEYSMSAPNFYLAFLSYIRSNHLDPLFIRCITSGGSWISPEEKNLIKANFGSEKYVEFYISSEAYMMGVSSPDSQVYHLFSDQHLFEILNDDQPVKPGEIGEIFVTTFDCTTVPLIRYKHRDGVKYLGQSSLISKFDSITDIHRAKEAQIGEGYVPYTDIERTFPGYFKKNGVPVFAMQLSKRNAPGDLLDIPIMRLETSCQDYDLVRRLADEAFRQNFEMDYLLKADMIRPLEVEIFEPGKLRQGKFKIPLYMDNHFSGDGEDE